MIELIGQMLTNGIIDQKGRFRLNPAHPAMKEENYLSPYLVVSREVAELMTYVDFSSNAGFMDEFTSALFIPHTDMKEFPDISELIKKKKIKMLETDTIN